jgi:hypothetical protein
MIENQDVLWTNEQIIFQHWLALPKKERKPKTIELFADFLNIGPATLYRWRKLDGFDAEVRKLIKENLHDDLPEIYAALRREAKIGNFQHIKLALELTGDYVQKIAPTSPDGKEQYDGGITETERSSRLAALLDRGRTRRDRLPTSDGPDTMETIAGTAE